MTDPILLAIMAAIVFAMALGIYMLYVSKRKDTLRKTQKSNDEFVIKVEQLIDEGDKYKSLWEEAKLANKILLDDFEQQRLDLREWIEVHERMEAERDQARALANDLREYLDHALELVKIQNEQIKQLLPKNKRQLRDGNGRFTNKFIDDGWFVRQLGRAERPAPTPVKHLREVNAEIAAAQGERPAVNSDFDVPQSNA